MKSLKIFLLPLILLAVMPFMQSCNTVKVNPGEVAVLVDQPWIFGHGGIRTETWGPGLQYTWPSTHEIKYVTAPIKYEEHFENIMTSDNNPVSFSAYVKISVLGDSAWYLHDKFLAEWYVNNIQQKFRTKVRNKACVYPMFTLTTDRNVSIAIETELQKEMEAYVKSIKMPVRVDEVNVGAIFPQKEVLAEIAKTAATVQNEKTQVAEANAQIKRQYAEEKRADADKAYMNRMGLSPEQFVTLEYIKALDKATTSGKSTFVVGQIPGLTINK